MNTTVRDITELLFLLTSVPKFQHRGNSALSASVIGAPSAEPLHI